MTFPMPPNEVERLQALHRLNILDGRLPSGLDRICSIAQSLFHVPVVLMVFLDEEVAWIKSGSNSELSKEPRALSFCNHTVMHDEVFVVPDTFADRRFAEHPYVKADPPLRFYAGAPFTTEPGVRIGSICLVDHVPRDFTPRQMNLLSSLARVAVDELWLHHLERSGLAPATEVLPLARKVSLDFQLEPSITSRQVRAGRGLLNWSVRELAEAAKVSPMTVKRIEASSDVLVVRDESAKAVRRALEEGGVEFVFSPDAEPGVRPR
ncbi:GAF domain-containing protein [Microvirga sp. GCM10011540]|uniref:GAF domain-containing protein n=1 Tax=Microvirga sp. GCM10011540 TaxID=3317338 RepID=UPI003621C6C9